jgi:hypothetical protein
MGIHLKHIGRSSSAGPPATGRRLFGAVAASVLTAAALVLFTAGSAMAASVPPTVTSAFTPSEIGAGDSTATALSITIANPNASGTLSGVGFTDTLPAGLTVDNPNGENGTCGSAGIITATPGASAISLSGGSVKAAASCTISVSVVASQVGVLQNVTGPIISSAGANTTGSTASVTVLAPPTVTVTGIKNNAKYTFGEVVKPSFTCTQPGDATALADCSAVDDLGNTINAGQALATKVAGSHTLDVTATSTDGLSTDDTFNYTVLPDNRFTVTAVKHPSTGVISFKLGLPGPGAVKVKEFAPHNVKFGTETVKITAKRTFTVKIKPTAAGKALLSAAILAKHAPPKIKLEVTYTPKGGKAKTVTKRGLALTGK